VIKPIQMHPTMDQCIWQHVFPQILHPYRLSDCTRWSVLYKESAQTMWRVLLYISHITHTCETSLFCLSGDEGFALLCYCAAHVASCLLMFKNSLSSRIKHAHIDKFICKGVMHDCTPPGSQSVVETCFLVIEILVVV